MIGRALDNIWLNLAAVIVFWTGAAFRWDVTSWHRVIDATLLVTSSMFLSVRGRERGWW